MATNAQDEIIRWLHISDFHMGKDEAGQREMCWDLLEEIEAKVDEGSCPDLVFITGDIANRGKASEYETFYTTFFQKLVDILKKGLGDEAEERIFLIPGNHDVDRTKGPKGPTGKVLEDTRWLPDLFQREPTVLDNTGPGQAARKLLRERFANFVRADMHSHTSVKNNWTNSIEGVYTRTLTIKGHTIGILGLNTAWLSGDYGVQRQGDRHELSPGKSMLISGLRKLKEDCKNACKDCKDCDIKIVLGHHPIDRFLDKEVASIEAWFGLNHVLYLHGDQHVNRVRERTDEEDRLFLTMQTGASFQQRDDKLLFTSLMWCELALKERKLYVHPLKWMVDKAGWHPDYENFPESSNRKVTRNGRTFWKYALVKTSNTPQVSTPDGWQVIDSEFLDAIRRKGLERDEAVTYLGGTNPTWKIALSDHIRPRKWVDLLVSRLRRATQQEKPHVSLLLGSAGEGKSTILLQTVRKLIEEEQTEWHILWHDIVDMPLHWDFWKALPADSGFWLVVSDDAHKIAENVYRMVGAMHRAGRRNIHFLLCSTDADWRSVRGHNLGWRADSDYPDPVDLELDKDDAIEIIKSWKHFEAMGKLNRNLSEEEAADELVKAARPPEDQGHTTLLGALFMVRENETQQEHVLKFLNRFAERDRNHAGSVKLLTAYAYIAALNAENFSILRKAILTQALPFDVDDLDQEVITPLSTEVTFNTFILTRHRAIAETAVQLLSDRNKFGINFDEKIYPGLFEAAIEVFDDKNPGKYERVPEITTWRRLPLYFSEKGRKKLAIDLAERATRLEPTDLLYVTLLGELHQKAEEFPQSADAYRRTFERLPEKSKDSLYYHKWATSEGRAFNYYPSIILDAIAIADRTTLSGTSLDQKNYDPDDRYKLALDGMSYDFKDLFIKTQDATFSKAWAAVTQLGVTFPWSSQSRNETHGHLQRSRNDSKKYVPEDVSIAEAINRFTVGVKAAQQLYEANKIRDAHPQAYPLPPRIRSVSALSFKRLEERLNEGVERKK